jgi:hypothetical protein
MSVTLNLPAEAEEAFLAEARARGLSPDDLLLDLLGREKSRTASDLTPEEWVLEFRNWVHSHSGDDLPLLSDEAISRESIYQDRGL